nr:MAG TPA: hypothetical protein [Caudoviricetes sp.]
MRFPVDFIRAFFIFARVNRKRLVSWERPNNHRCSFSSMRGDKNEL